MSQNSLILPTTGTVSGLQMTQNINNALDSLNTLNSGASAPSTLASGMLWHDTSANILKIRNQANSAWINITGLDESNNLSNPLNVFSKGFVNLLRNPSMQVAQRGTSGTATAGAGAYTLDGWQLLATGANQAWSQGGTLGYPALKSLSITGNTGVTNTQFFQRIESNVVGYVDGQQITFQAQIFNNTGAAITPNLSVTHAGSSDNWTSPVTDLTATNLQTIASGATATVSYTYTAAAGSSNGLQFILGFGSALNSNTKSVSISNVDARISTGVASGLNNAPPSPEIRSYPLELVFCQRYYQIVAYLSATATSATAMNAGEILPVVMRAAPTAGQSGVLNSQGTTNPTQSAVGLGTNFSTAYSLYFSGVPNFTGLTAGQSYLLAVPANNANYITLSAEL